MTPDVTFDDLTGLPLTPGRISTFDMPSELRADSALILINLVDFKAVNDRYGHASGDRVLAELGRRLGAAGGDATVYREGGNSFLAFVEVARSDDDVRAVATQLRELIARPIVMDEGQIEIRTSIAAVRTAGGRSFRDLYAIVDHAAGAVRQNHWPEVLVAPSTATADTWYERPHEQ